MNQNLPISRIKEDDSLILIAFICVAGLIWALFATQPTGFSALTYPTLEMHGYMMMSAFLIGLLTIAVKVTNGLPQINHGEYEDGVIKAGVIATTFWGIAGMLVGLIIACQLTWPNIFYFENLPWTNFGRLRPLHTSAVIFAFGGNALIATSFYVVQRTCRTRLAGGMWPWFVFWGYQLFIVLAATGYLLGVTQSREYAEPEWYVDIWLTIVWVSYLLIFLCTLAKRKEPHIYVANWFYLAFIITVAILHLVNNLALPTGAFDAKSYGVFSGVQDAMTQWWYGHNAVGVLRMLVVSVAFYGMATFEGPLMSIRYVNALSHYTEWTIGHVHSGALGWNGFVTFGALYCLVPWLWKKKELYSVRLVEWHFWLATIGIVFYITAMWVAGIGEGLMWRAYTDLGFLEYAIIESVSAKHISYAVRALGGGLFLLGTLIMAFNLHMTIRGKGLAQPLDGDVPLTKKPAIPASQPVLLGE